MKATCKIVIDFDNEKKVKNVLKSIEVDNLRFVKAHIKGKTLEADIESKSVSSLLHTLDDYLACVSVAEKIVDKN
jgi:tRNA threonylcarbamoyladenosine modification (KEOPS) complex  Pcc1 subunit